jgi:hypothetical protein
MADNRTAHISRLQAQLAELQASATEVIDECEFYDLPASDVDRDVDKSASAEIIKSNQAPQADAVSAIDEEIPYDFADLPAAIAELERRCKGLPWWEQQKLCRAWEALQRASIWTRTPGSADLLAPSDRGGSFNRKSLQDEFASRLSRDGSFVSYHGY